MKGKVIVILILIMMGGCFMNSIGFKGFGKHPEIKYEETTIQVENLGFGESDKRPEIVETSTMNIDHNNKKNCI